MKRTYEQVSDLAVLEVRPAGRTLYTLPFVKFPRVAYNERIDTVLGRIESLRTSIPKSDYETIIDEGPEHILVECYEKRTVRYIGENPLPASAYHEAVVMYPDQWFIYIAFVEGILAYGDSI